jgi:hypothetical protein
MKKFSTVFNQILQLLPHDAFERAIKQFKTDRYVKHFTTKALLAVHLFAQIRQKDSLRDILCGLNQHQSSWYHIGVQNIAKSTMGDANNRIDYRVYEDLFYQMLAKCQFGKQHRFSFENKLYALDATTIDLCLGIIPWAKFRKTKGGIKVHCLYDIKEQIPALNVISTANVHEVKVARDTDLKLIPDSIITFDRAYLDFNLFHTYQTQGIFFVTRDKKNSRFQFLGQHSIPTQKGVQFDHIVQVSDPNQLEKYPGKLRLVGFWDEKTNNTYQFLTNNFILDAADIAKIYKARWDIELFFKWIKQTLKIKTFLGTSKNAVLSQIWVAMIYTLLLAYIKFQSKFSHSVLNLARIFQESLFHRLHLLEVIGFRPDKVPRNTDFVQLSLC